MSIDPLPTKERRTDASGISGFLGFEVVVTTVDTEATVRIIGDLDCYTAPQLRAALMALADGGTRHLTVDIGSVQFVDSTGLSALVGGMKRLRDHGGSMVVKSPTEATRRLFEITGLNRVFVVA